MSVVKNGIKRSQMRIALIEDENYLNDAIKELLRCENYEVDSFNSLKDFLKKSNLDYDVIIADISLPDGDFLQELSKHKAIGNETKIIIMSAHSEIDNIRKAFNLGAEDFLKKPFEPEELLLRLDKIFKTKKTKLDENLFYDPESKSIIFNEEKEILTKKEAALLELLIKNKGRFVSFETISHVVWEEKVPSNTIAALVKRLRNKLKNKSLIISKREIGYMLVEK